MDASGRLRRHNSTPARSHRHSAWVPSRLRSKTNPYIGAFRHSPPTSFRSIEAFNGMDVSTSSLSSSSLPLRRSPYIGWFRHAPPIASQVNVVDAKRLIHLDCFHRSLLLEKFNDKEIDLSKIINGRLLGGGKIESIEDIDTSEVFRYTQRLLQDTTSEGSSNAVKLLTRLGSWFLFPLAYDAESCGYKNNFYNDLNAFPILSNRPNVIEEEEELDEDEESDSDESDSDERSITPLQCDDEHRVESPHSDEALGVSVSNVAQAYYAHQAIDQGDDFSSDGHNLDYVITQMDIARMARNASRHLEVDSILKLPTITYHPTRLAESKDDKAWSFVMVEGSSLDQTSVSTAAENDHFCVICLDKFEEGDRLRVLPCQHSFHVGCIDRWLCGSHSHLECFTSGCPICKKRPMDVETSTVNDGSVPSWAFASIGKSLSS